MVRFTIFAITSEFEQFESPVGVSTVDDKKTMSMQQS